MHSTALWEKLLKSPLSLPKPARPDQIKWFETFSANRIRLIKSQKCLKLVNGPWESSWCQEMAAISSGGGGNVNKC